MGNRARRQNKNDYAIGIELNIPLRKRGNVSSFNAHSLSSRGFCYMKQPEITIMPQVIMSEIYGRCRHACCKFRCGEIDDIEVWHFDIAPPVPKWRGHASSAMRLTRLFVSVSLRSTLLWAGPYEGIIFAFVFERWKMIIYWQISLLGDNGEFRNIACSPLYKNELIVKSLHMRAIYNESIRYRMSYQWYRINDMTRPMKACHRVMACSIALTFLYLGVQWHILAEQYHAVKPRANAQYRRAAK